MGNTSRVDDHDAVHQPPLLTPKDKLLALKLIKECDEGKIEGG